MLVNIFVERAEAAERSDMIFLSAERGCFTLRFSNVFSESGGFFFREFVMHGFEGIGKRLGFRFRLEVGDFRLGIIASCEGFVCFVAGIRI